MAWDQRGKHRYYYRHRREGDRVHKIYVGTGPGAELAAAHDECRRARCQREAELVERERGRVAVAELPLVDFFRDTELLVRASLLVAGYHQHCHGDWRKRHEEHEERNLGHADTE